MDAVASVLLFLHVLGAIAAFGPSFVFPILGAGGAREPQHGGFALKMSEAVERRLVIPIGLTMPVTGALMIWYLGFDLFVAHWLALAIVVYAVAMGYAIFVQLPVVERLVALTSHAPAAAPAGAPASGAPAGGPPPEFLALVRRSQQGGMLLTALLLVIIFLMVVKPAF
jgi:uncharacterized membrane protein